MEFSLLGQQLAYYSKQATVCIWSKLGLSLILVSLAPHVLALHGLALIFVLDFVCGVWVAKRARTLSSLGMRRGVAKLFIYFIFIGAVAVAEHSVLQTNVCTLTAIGILSATEVLSILENLVLLGLPIPFATKILTMVGNKAANYGVKLDLEDLSSMASAKDIIYMIEVTIPAITDANTRRAMGIFVRNWYQFMRALDTSAFTGSHELMWERLRHGTDRTIVDIRSLMMRESIPLSLQDEFMQRWVGDLLKGFMVSAKAATDADVEPLKQISMVRDSLCLMLFRLLQVCEDKKVLSGP